MTIQGAFDKAVARAMRTGEEWVILWDPTIFDMPARQAYHIARLDDFEQETFYYASKLIKVVG